MNVMPMQQSMVQSMSSSTPMSPQILIMPKVVSTATPRPASQMASPMMAPAVTAPMLTRPQPPPPPGPKPMVSQSNNSNNNMNQAVDLNVMSHQFIQQAHPQQVHQPNYLSNHNMQAPPPPPPPPPPAPRPMPPERSTLSGEAQVFVPTKYLSLIHI